MSFTNAQLAQQIANLIEYWSGFNEEYANWLGGVVGGGTNLDGKYPLTDWTGNTLLVKAPAQLQDDVDNITSGATAQANAAAASAAAAAASASTATTQAGLADTARIAAEAAEAVATTKESSAVNASVTAVAQANLATDRAGYAQEWAVKATAVSVAAGGDGSTTFSAKYWAEVAQAFSGSIDTNLYAQLAQNETVTGQYTFSHASGILIGAAPLTAALIGNWNTAYGWGNHASAGYQPAGVYAVLSSLAQNDTFLLLNRSNASNPALHVTQADAGPVARFGGGSLGAAPTSDVVEINKGNVTINGDGEFLTLKNDNHISTDVLLNTWIRFKGSDNVDMAWIGHGSNSNNDLGIYHSLSGYNIRMGTVGSGDVLIGTGANGALEITGSGYKTNPTGLRLGQYTSTRTYVQAPAGGQVEIWNDNTSAIATFKDDLSAEFAGAVNVLGNLQKSGVNVLTAVPATESPLKATELSSSVNLDTLLVNQAGFYYQTANADTPGNNYPSGEAGSLLVQKSAGSATQLYITYPTSNNKLFFRSYYGGAWGAWQQVSTLTNAETISGAKNFTTAPLKSSLGIPYYVTSGYTGGRITVSTTAPSSPATGDIWFDTN